MTGKLKVMDRSRSSGLAFGTFSAAELAERTDPPITWLSPMSDHMFADAGAEVRGGGLQPCGQASVDHPCVGQHGDQPPAYQVGIQVTSNKLIQNANFGFRGERLLRCRTVAGHKCTSCFI